MKLKSFLVAVMSLCSFANMTAENKFFIEDFSIEAGETKEIEICLTNDVAFSGFQADIYLPEGLTFLEEDGDYIFDLSGRKHRTHTISAAKQADGSIRLLSYSTTSKEYSGNEGALVYCEIVASGDFKGTHEIVFDNVKFAQSTGVEILFESTKTKVTGPAAEAKISSVSFDVALLNLYVGETYSIKATIEPADATAVLSWTSSNENVATVSADGQVTALAAGNAIITATTTDGSNLSASCELVVSEAEDVPEDEVLLTIKDAENGQISMVVASGSSAKLKFETEAEWYISVVLFNEVDVTEQLDENRVFVTPELTENAIINVTYSKESTKVANMLTSDVKVYGYNGQVTVSGATEGDSIEVFNVDGKLIKAENVDSDVTTLSLPNEQVYIVKCNNRSFKVRI